MRTGFKLLSTLIILPMFWLGSPIFRGNTVNDNTKKTHNEYTQNSNCIKPTTWDKLKFDMTPDEVKSLWGEPMDDSTLVMKGIKTLYIMGYCCESNHCKYKLYFEANKLMAWEKN